MNDKRRPDLYIAENSDDLFETAARRFVAAVGESLGSRDSSRVCLAGGATPAALYRVLASNAYRSRVPWDRVHFFWGDERAVPPDDARSNYLMAQEAMLSHLTLRPGQVHRILGERPAGVAAGLYQDELMEHFDIRRLDAPPVFDLVLLGIGEDGHTASLFPDSRALREDQRWVVEVEAGGESRVSLTLPVLNAARRILFLASGESKARAVDNVIEGNVEPERWPAKLVRPASGRVTWLLDRAAASQLSDRA